MAPQGLILGIAVKICAKKLFAFFQFFGIFFVFFGIFSGFSGKVFDFSGKVSGFSAMSGDGSGDFPETRPMMFDRSFLPRNLN